MDPPKSDVQKLSNMVMCGDHPSFIKTESNVKDIKVDVKEKEKTEERAPMCHPKLIPSSSRTGAVEQRGRASSDHTLRWIEARRRVRSLEVVRSPGVEVTATGNRALVQAALGSFRWPPYLLAVWVLVLILTHVLHCLVSALERSLPAIKKLCQYFRAWTEDSWKLEPTTNHHQRVYPLGLACVTGLFYILYFSLYAFYSVALWSIEPLCGEVEEKKSLVEERDVGETKVTDYEGACSKTSTNIKQ